MKIIRINNKNGHLLNNLNSKENGTVLFYHPQCYHCQMMKPEWEKAKQLLMKEKKNCNIYEVNGEYMDDINHPLKNSVSGFPTILNLNNGKIQSFNEERNMNNMLQFILGNIKNDKKAKQYIKKKVSFKLNNDLIKNKKILNAKNLVNNLILNKERMNKKRTIRKKQKKTTTRKKQKKRTTLKKKKKRKS